MVDEVYEKEGKRGGTMRFAEIVTEFRDETGKLVAEAAFDGDRDRQGHRRKVRDGATLGRPAGGPAPSRATFGPINRTDFVRYQGASGDFNPIHHDEEFAKAAGYPSVFSVGMLQAGILAGVRDRLARCGQRAPLRGAVPRAGLAG